MGNRFEEIQKIAESLSAGDFEKIATDDTLKKEAQDPTMMGGAPPMDPAMMGGPPPMMPPEALPPAGGEGSGSEGSEAAKGMKEVALRALDLTQGAVAEALDSDTLSEADKVDATAAALESSGALNGIPPEELEALAQQPPPPL
jgi:hypothetical protein